MNSRCIAVVITMGLMAFLICGLGGEQGEGVLSSAAALHKMAGPPAAEAAESDEAALYQMDIKPLTPADCARCHYPIYETLKNAGGKHQIDCARCHREYHVYNPRKQNFDEIMPDCAWCHVSDSGGAFHGEHPNLTPCLNCHADPHKPLSIPMSKAEASCGFCHDDVNQQLQSNLSKHTTEVGCADCHADKHGFIPECSACHESHSPDMQFTMQDCMACHPVHKPLRIAYPKDTDSVICAGCHQAVYDMLQTNVTKHTAVACADCHPTHREIPACSRCHGEPHPKAMLRDTTMCGDCHGIAHNLPMM